MPADVVSGAWSAVRRPTTTQTDGSRRTATIAEIGPAVPAVVLIPGRSWPLFEDPGSCAPGESQDANVQESLFHRQRAARHACQLGRHTWCGAQASSPGRLCDMRVRRFDPRGPPRQMRERGEAGPMGISPLGITVARTGRRKRYPLRPATLLGDALVCWSAACRPVRGGAHDSCCASVCVRWRCASGAPL